MHPTDLYNVGEKPQQKIASQGSHFDELACNAVTRVFRQEVQNDSGDSWEFIVFNGICFSLSYHLLVLPR